MVVKLKANLKLLLGINLILILSSCDPARILTIINETGNNVVIEIELENCKYGIIETLNKKQYLKQIDLGMDKKDKTK